jgi:alcohol dehydrogenase
MIPAVIRFNAALPEAAESYARLAVGAGIAGTHLNPNTAVEALVDAVQSVLRTAGIPATLQEAGADPDQIPMLATEAARQWTAGFNPRPIAAPDFEELYRSIATA